MASRDPMVKYEGKFVVMNNGKVLASSNTLKEAYEKSRRLEGMEVFLSYVPHRDVLILWGRNSNAGAGKRADFSLPRGALWSPW